MSTVVSTVVQTNVAGESKSELISPSAAIALSSTEAEPSMSTAVSDVELESSQTAPKSTFVPILESQVSSTSVSPSQFTPMTESLVQLAGSPSLLMSTPLSDFIMLTSASQSIVPSPSIAVLISSSGIQFSPSDTISSSMAVSSAHAEFNQSMSTHVSSTDLGSPQYVSSFHGGMQPSPYLPVTSSISYLGPSPSQSMEMERSTESLFSTSPSQSSVTGIEPMFLSSSSVYMSSSLLESGTSILFRSYQKV